MKKIFFIAAIGFNPWLLSAATFTYQLRDFGETRSEGVCRTNIQTVARDFGQMAGVTVLGADCVRSEVMFDGLTGEISYVAAVAVESVTSDVKDFGGHSGFYSTLAACQAGLGRELVIFKEVTKLSPFVSYCYRSNSVGPAVHRARIDAVGTSEMQKFSTFSDYFNNLADPVAVLATVNDRAVAQGMTVVESAIQRDLSGLHVAMDYYSTKKIYIHAEEKLSYETAEDCQSAAEGLHSSWAFSSIDLIYACTTKNRQFGLAYIWLSESLFNDGDFDTEVLPIAYDTVSACQQDRERVVSAISASGSTVFGSICGISDQKPRVLVIIARPVPT